MPIRQSEQTQLQSTQQERILSVNTQNIGRACHSFETLTTTLEHAGGRSADQSDNRCGSQLVSMVTSPDGPLHVAIALLQPGCRFWGSQDCGTCCAGISGCADGAPDETDPAVG